MGETLNTFLTGLTPQQTKALESEFEKIQVLDESQK